MTISFVSNSKNPIELSDNLLILLRDDNLSFNRFEDDIIEDHRSIDKEIQCLKIKIDIHEISFTYRIIKDNLTGKESYSYMESIIIDNTEVMTEKNIIINQDYLKKHNLNYELIIKTLSSLVFNTKDQHFIQQKYLKNWSMSDRPSNKNIPYYDLKNKKYTSDRNTKGIFYEKYIYKYFENNKLYYLEKGLITMYETKFLKAIENIKKEDLDKTHSLLKNNEFWHIFIFSMLRNPTIFKNNLSIFTKKLNNHTNHNKQTIITENFIKDYSKIFKEHTINEFLNFNLAPSHIDYKKILKFS